MDSKEKIKGFIMSNLLNYNKDISLKDDDDIFSQGYVNSLFSMKLLLFVEKEFDIKVSNEEMKIENFSSINNIHSLINKKQ